MPQCTITNNQYSSSATGTYGLPCCIAIYNSKITGVVWFYLPPNGTGVLITFQNAQYSSSPSNCVPWLYVGLDGKLYASDWIGSFWQISITLNPGWHMAVVEEWAASASGPYYLALYLDGKFIGQTSTTSLPDMFGLQGAESISDIGTGYSCGGWPGFPADNWLFFNGTIAYIALYNTILNQTQVQQLYQSGFPNTLYSNNLVISYILDPTYYNNNSYYFIPYYVNTQLMSQMGINNYNAVSIIPNGSIGPIPSSQFVYESNLP
jgi:hypothetical protein